MKRLKKLSLKHEIDREAENIEKEIKSRTDLEDLKVSEDMETSLFNKIQEYEYDKRYKTVHRRKKKRYVVLALAAVLVLVFGSVMTGVGSKSYWKILWDRMIGEEAEVSFIEVENMDTHETEDIDELKLFKTIREKLGISSVRFGYVPKGMVLAEYELDYEQNRAVLIYEYNQQTIRYSMYMNDADSSFVQTELDKLTNEYKILSDNDVGINVKEYEIEGTDKKRYLATFEYMDAQYEIKGIIKREEIDEILKNLYFSQ